MHHSTSDFKDYIKAILIWGLPGLYVATVLSAATWVASSVHIF